ncbi:FAD linked oxidase domain-containingprotein [Purpureocillium lavendulum]|uniref:FAD linked oxidase domain-containingprotein n=1 Tax=Purpureocillium lavendulum TaxID=1247861 RepID=A0AB34FEJ9_9HYPO|nr:FAD linked oxidase domain-containingprotein [Purpureocillium lavendulum]
MDQEFIVDAANAILRAKAPAAERDDPPTRQKTLNADRAASEDLDRVVEYFQKLQDIIEEAGILSEDIWNMDETGFRIGVGKDQLIITKRKRSHYFSIPENRESATLIEAISAGGRNTPAFIILAGQNHMAHWYHQQELEPETVLRPTPSGYSNDEISLEWIQHFNKHTEKCRKGWKRLLILDGHGSHHTKEFIEYCDKHSIIPFGLPPNLTHLLQPLDVVVFQPLKHYHAKALDLMARDGLINITKIEFLSCIQDVRKEAFKESTIRSAFGTEQDGGVENAYSPSTWTRIFAIQYAVDYPTNQ